jgi:hypothetical protein
LGLSGLKLEKADNKTFIGRIERGLDFLGYHFYPGSLRPSKKVVHNFVERLRLRCYASGRKRGCNGGGNNIGLYAVGRYACSSVSAYARRWLTWANSALNGMKVETINLGIAAFT